MGRLFGPVMCLWFTAIGVIGVAVSPPTPLILKALSPSYAAGFLTGHFGTAFFALAAVVLAVTVQPRRCTRTWGTSAARRLPASG